MAAAPEPPVHVRIGAKTREYVVSGESCASLRENRIELAGLSEAKPGFSFARTEMGREQILVSLSGRGRVLVDGAWRECPPGTAYVTPQVGLHAYRASGDWHVGWIIFARNHPRTPGLGRARMQEAHTAPLAAALRGLYEEATTAREPRLLRHWGEILYACGHRILHPAPAARLSPLWQAVRARLDFPWTLPELCRIAGSSAENLRLICLAETGTSPMRHLCHLRMERAASFLRLGYKVEEAAKAVGYRNAFAFSTTFKRRMGAAPSVFQRGT